MVVVCIFTTLLNRASHRQLPLCLCVSLPSTWHQLEEVSPPWNIREGINVLLKQSPIWPLSLFWRQTMSQIHLIRCIFCLVAVILVVIYIYLIQYIGSRNILIVAQFFCSVLLDIKHYYMDENKSVKQNSNYKHSPTILYLFSLLHCGELMWKSANSHWLSTFILCVFNLLSLHLQIPL